MRNETQATVYHLISYGVSLLLSIGCSMPLFHITAILRLVDPIISVGQGCGGLSVRVAMGAVGQQDLNGIDHMASTV